MDPCLPVSDLFLCISCARLCAAGILRVLTNTMDAGREQLPLVQWLQEKIPLEQTPEDKQIKFYTKFTSFLHGAAGVINNIFLEIL